MKYNPVTGDVIQALQQITGEKYVKTDPDVLAAYQSDESLAPDMWHLPEVVVAPGSTEEVARIMKVANQYKNTGYPAQCRYQCQLWSCSRLRRHRPFDGTDEPHPGNQ